MAVGKIGVRDLAKELGITDRELTERANKVGVKIVSTFAQLEEADAAKLRRLIAPGRVAPSRAAEKPVPVAAAPAATVVRRVRRPDELDNGHDAAQGPAPSATQTPAAAHHAPAASLGSIAAPAAAASHDDGSAVAPAASAPVVSAEPAVTVAAAREPESVEAATPHEWPAPSEPVGVDHAPGAEEPRPIETGVTPAAVLIPAGPQPRAAMRHESPKLRKIKASDLEVPPELQLRISSMPVVVPKPEPVPPPVEAIAAPLPVAVQAVVVPVQPAPRLRIEDIGKALDSDTRLPSQNRKPTLVRMKMPEIPVAPPRPPRPVQPEVVTPVQAPPVEAGPPREGGEPVDAKGNRGGRKVIYDRRRDSQSTATADARGRGKKKGGKLGKGMQAALPLAGPTRAEKRNIRIEDTITVANLAATMSVKSTEVIRALFQLGVMATVNQPLDLDTVELIAGEFGFTVENVGFDLDQYLQKPEAAPGGLVSRSPVVTVMGHVDHGKTSLLDAIRKTHTAAKEAGGITQHIGAYVAQVSGAQFADGLERRVVFLDTPGHEAFSAMRARGAKATDVIVLVVAADDGVMPQTIEALNHGKAAKVPIIVAVNKIDKPGADLERVRRELADHGIMSEDWGGEAIFCEVSAKTGQGIDKLLEMLALQADVLQLEANPDSDARGLVIESRLEKGRGPVATLLVQQGTLKKGQYIVAGSHYCRVRAMLSDLGKPLEQAGPSTPVEVIGFDHVTSAGDEFYVVADEKKAKAIVDHRVEKLREKEQLKTSKRTLEDMFGTAGATEVKELNLIIKADVHGSAEALKAALSKIEHEEVKVRVLHAAVGGVTESDINLASTTKGAIIAFNVKPEAKGKRLADDLGVAIRQYSVIYDAIDDVTVMLEGMLTPIIEEVILGHAEVRQIFSVPKLGVIGGSNVLDGVMQRNQKLRVLRGKDIIHEGEFASLKRFKDDVKEVAQGYDCGIGIVGFTKFQIGDKVECYELRKIARKLKPEGQTSRGG